VYNVSGALQSGHTVTGSVTLSGGTAKVTLSGAAAFTSSTSYVCVATPTTAATVSVGDFIYFEFIRRHTGGKFRVLRQLNGLAQSYLSAGCDAFLTGFETFGRCDGYCRRITKSLQVRSVKPMLQTLLSP